MFFLLITSIIQISKNVENNFQLSEGPYHADSLELFKYIKDFTDMLFDQYYQNCWIPVCGGARVQQDDRRSWIYPKKNPYKTGPIYKIWPLRRLVLGCSGSRYCAEHKQIWLGGDVWVYEESIWHAYRPWYLPACCSKCDGARQKRKNGPNIASFNGHAHIICWNDEKSNCTCGLLVKFWYKNILSLSPNSK